MMTASESVMLRPRASDALRPRLRALRHAGSFGLCSGSSCFAWLLLAVCILVVLGETPTAPVLAMRQNCSSLKQAVTAFMRAIGVQDMAIQEWMETVVSDRGAEVEITSLPVEPPTETSAPVTADREVTSTTRPHSDNDRTPAAATPPSAHPCNGPIDEAAVFFFWSLSTDEKRERLLQAANDGAVKEVTALLVAGADVGARGEDNLTALHRAAFWGHVEAVRCLLQAGAEVDARESRWRAAPLHMAALRGHTAVVRLLLAASADPNARAVGGVTPLLSAAHWGHTEAAAALLEAGADKGATDDEGETALDLARWNHHHQLIQMLQRY